MNNQDTGKLERLILVAEGGVHTLEYITSNGVIPNKALLDITKFGDILPYIEVCDDILLIINGLTDFTLADIYGFLNICKNNKNKIGRLTVLSNVMLGTIDTEYYFYTGDLFYGGVSRVVRGKIVRDETLEEVSEDTKKSGAFSIFRKNKSQLQENTGDNRSKNTVAFRYKVYNCRNVKVQIYGKEKTSKEESKNARNVSQRVKTINLFEKQED